MNMTSTQKAVLALLAARSPGWVTTDEIRAVGGREATRRLRELRLDFKYQIETKGGSYRLLGVEPQAPLANPKLEFGKPLCSRCDGTGGTELAPCMYCGGKGIKP